MGYGAAALPCGEIWRLAGLKGRLKLQGAARCNRDRYPIGLKPAGVQWRSHRARPAGVAMVYRAIGADIDSQNARPMLFGYARVSTREQDTAMQREALIRAGVSVFFEESRSGVKHRPELEFLLGQVRQGDTLLVYKIDRLARSLRDLLRITEALDKAGCALRSLTEPIDTSTPAGRAMFQLIGVFAELERSLIRERCHAGMQSAKARGVRLGRCRKANYAEVLRMRNEGQTIRRIAIDQGVSHATICKALARLRDGLARP